MKRFASSGGSLQRGTPEYPERPQAAQQVPSLTPGDMVTVIETRWNDVIKNQTGIYSKPGYPKTLDLDSDISPREMGHLRRENMVGCLKIGDQCMVVAVCKEPSDSRWYLLLSCGHVLGWTRTWRRFRKVRSG